VSEARSTSDDDRARFLEQRLTEAEKLAGIVEDVSAGLLLDEVLDRVYDRFREIIPYHRIGCALLSDDRRLLTARWVRGESATVRLGAGYSARMAGSSLEAVLSGGRPRILNDLRRYLAENPSSRSTRLMVEEGMQSSLTCPLLVRHEAVGFLFFSSRQNKTYEAIHQETFVRIAQNVSIAIEKARLYQDLQQANEQLRQQVVRDPLTGLLNQGAIVELLHKEVARQTRHQASVGIAMIDVDGFKAVNDTHGHPVGDLVLREVAVRLGHAVRRSDSLGRYGGEEFLVIFSEASLEAAVLAAERLRQSVDREPVRLVSGPIPVTISIGVAVARQAGAASSEALVAAADHRLYEAKRNGRNRIAFGAV
jgi:diguanylate cyclase (GGDEF)-like protein